MQTQTQTQGWHIANWGTWGWLETAVKAVGIVAGWIAFTQVAATSTIQLTGAAHIASVVLLGLLTVLFLLLIVMRIMQREIISIIFSISNGIGHAGMLYYLLNTPDATVLPLVFGLAFAAGEVVKQRFLAISGYTENGAQTPQMIAVSRGIMSAYLLFAVLVLL